MKLSILTVIIVSIFSQAAAQNDKTKKLDDLFKLLEENNKAMGSFVISQNGSVVYSKVIGYRYYSEHEKIPADINTKYRIGSVSKLFTATIIFQLIEEGKIDLSSTLDKYFPELPNGKKITISNLLNHRSGLKNFRALKTGGKHRTEEQLLQMLYKTKMEFAPGTKSSYSNSNYVLLAYIIEKICNKSYDAVLNEKILSKVGLKNTCTGHQTIIKDNESYSYKFKKTWEQQPQTDMSIVTGTGAIMSTPRDLTKFIESLFSGKLVTKNSLAQMKTVKDGFGMGIIPFPFYERTGYGHYGGIDNFISLVAYFPEDNVAVAYCTNAEVYPVKDILITAASIYFDKDYSLPVFSTPASKVLSALVK